MEIVGNVPGFSCHLSRFTHPSELLCVTLCANKSDVDLTELARRIAGAFNRKLGPPVGPTVMTCHESCYPWPMTVDRLAERLKTQGFEIVERRAAGGRREAAGRRIQSESRNPGDGLRPRAGRRRAPSARPSGDRAGISDQGLGHDGAGRHRLGRL